MLDNQFELDGFLMGRGQPVAARAVTPGSAESTNQDSRFRDRTHQGRDYRSGHVWGLEMVVRGKDPAAARQALRGVAKAFAEDTTPGSESVLRYNIAGETCRVYGRPRNYESNPNRLTYMGRATAAGEFVTNDAFHYSDTLQSSGRLTLLPPPSGGVQLPATLPFTLAESAPTNGSVVVGGDAPAPVEIFVHGPLTGVWAVTVGGYRVEVDHSMAYDRWLVIDTRKMTVLADDGSNLSGKLSRKVFLPDVRLQPGPAEINFEGTSSNGTAYAEVQFRDTHYGF